MAATVARTSRAGGPIRVANDWTRVSLGYYLARLEGAPRGTLSPRVRIATASPPAVEADRCGALVVAGFPERTDFDPLFLRSPAQLRFPRTDAKLLALSPTATDPSASRRFSNGRLPSARLVASPRCPPRHPWLRDASISSAPTRVSCSSDGSSSSATDRAGRFAGRRANGRPRGSRREAPRASGCTAGRSARSGG